MEGPKRIKTAIIGLSHDLTWASMGHWPWFAFHGRDQYNVIALCGSSVEAAKKAIAKYHFSKENCLEEPLRAYGSPEDVAADPDVELVVVCTPADKHYETALPSIKAGKDVYVEWPLADNLDQAREMAALAREKGGKTIVGLQGRYSPVICCIKWLLGTASFSKVVSSQIRASGKFGAKECVADFAKKSIDGSFNGKGIGIVLGHLMDCVQYVLGDIENIQARLQLQRPELLAVTEKHRPYDAALGLEPVESNRPDMIFLHGTLPASEVVAEGATISITYTDRSVALGEPSLEWTFQQKRDTAEIRIRVYGDPTMNKVDVNVMRNSTSDQSDRVVIEKRFIDTWEECSDIYSDIFNNPCRDIHDNLAWYEELAKLPRTTCNIAALWDDFASADDPEHPKRYWQQPDFERPDFELALKRQKQIVDILDGFYQANGPDKAVE
ncbi:hypothetical protein E8E14_000010 [Neopestalotiopsis sp. 37M]|nr:hypothetical protein E8E14_000010 [Neopestalotiopsis sp. 37M]